MKNLRTQGVWCAVPFLALVAFAATAAGKPAYLDTSRSNEERAADLVSRMTLEEKTSQLGRNTAAVPRLGVAKYDYWNEALHGIQNGTGEGTSFPMPLSLAQTWDEAFIRRVASAIGDECRGHNQPVSEGGRGRGLTYWCPTINLARHPLWGRTNEAYGEDAFVSGQLASAFIEGMQGDGKYLKTVPTIKHYALNNHENQRGSTSSDASEADIRDYYARVYRYVIERTDVPSLMSAYNAVNFTPSSANTFLLTTLLRNTFGFTGFVVSDCGAIDNIERQQKWRPDRNQVPKNNYVLTAGTKLSDYLDADGVVTKPGSVALAINAGNDMDCNGDIYPVQARRAFDAGLLTESQISLSVYNNLLARFKLGEFDPVEDVPYRGEAWTFANTVETDAHRALADEAASRSVVLLKNQDDILPLNAKKLRRLVIVGDLADTCFLGNYCGKPKMKNRISVWAGIDDYLYVKNPKVELTLVSKFGENGAIRPEDRQAIETADAVLVVATDEHDDSSEGRDRAALVLTRNQNEIIRNVAVLNEDTIVFLQTSNVVELGAFKDKVKAIFWSSQNGQGQGVGVANQIFGEVNPSGKLTFTWFAKESELPGIRQYGLVRKYLPEEKDYPKGGFTYQYFNGAVDYPFGYGLSYTTYTYGNAKIAKRTVDANEKLALSVEVTNTGKRAGSEVVQAYVVYPKAKNLPKKQIKAFAKLDLAPGETKTANLTIDMADCCFWDGTKRVVPTGDYRIEIGASSTDIKASFPVTVTGALSETINVFRVDPRDVSVKVGQKLIPTISISLKDDSFLPVEKAELSFVSSDERVVRVCRKGVVTGVAPGVATITATARYKGSVKTCSYPMAVIPEGGVKTDPVAPIARVVPLKASAPRAKTVDRNALEEAIRIKVQGDDYDPVTYDAYLKEIAKARRVFFKADATQAEVDAAHAALMAVKDKLRDFRYLVADFKPANREWGFGNRTIWVNWSNAKDAEGRNTTVDMSAHDPRKLELRFTITLTPSDCSIPFAEAVSGGGYIKLRSVNVGQKDNDPDLQVFGGSLMANDEHNFGWNATDYIHDWGTTEVVVPLAIENPDGTIGLPYIDKGFRAKGPKYYSRGKIDWTMIDRFFLQLNFKDSFRNKASVITRIADCRVVDVTLEEERERLSALLDEKVGKTACDCPIKEETYRKAVAAAKEALAGESVLRIRQAIADLIETRKATGAQVTTDKDALKRLLLDCLKNRELARYTPESVAAYKKVVRDAKAVLDDPKACQFKVNRAVKAMASSKALLKLLRVKPAVIATLLSGEQTVERHSLEAGFPVDLDLSAEADYTVMVRYEVKFESTHARKPANDKWLMTLVNGSARVWGDVARRNNETAVKLAVLNCARDSALVAYRRPGEWFTLMHEIPVSQLVGGKLTRFEMNIFNDSGKFVSDPDDGIEWSNDSGIRMTIRNVEILTDRPRL